jgi:hypothetical protein
VRTRAGTDIDEPLEIATPRRLCRWRPRYRLEVRCGSLDWPKWRVLLYAGSSFYACAIRRRRPGFLITVGNSTVADKVLAAADEEGPGFRRGLLSGAVADTPVSRRRDGVL